VEDELVKVLAGWFVLGFSILAYLF